MTQAYEFQWVSFSIRFPADDADLPQHEDLAMHAECLEGMTRNGWEPTQTLFSEAASLTSDRHWTLLTLLRRPLAGCSGHTSSSS